MMRMAAFTVLGQPVPKARPRLGHGRGFTPQATRDAEARVSDAFIDGLGTLHAIDEPITLPLRVRIRFFREDKRRVDLDNLEKTVLDALNRIAWADDSQIVSLIASKHLDRDRPRTEVEIWTVGDLT